MTLTNPPPIGKAATVRLGASDPQTDLSVVPCRDYAETTIKQALLQLLKPFGGLGNLVHSGDRVLLKPNLLSARGPDAAATTHPLLVEFLASACRQLGAQVFIGDSPPLTLRRIEDFWEQTGMAQAAQRSGATLVCFEREPRRELTVAGPHGPVRIHVTEEVFKANVTINLPKLKTHNLTVLTGAVKNHYGLLPGLQKAQWHRLLPQPDDFSRLLVSICEATPMTLHLMDGIMGMDGQGPAGGRPVPTGVLLAATNPAAVDLGVCSITGADPTTVPTLHWYQRLQQRPYNREHLRFHGADPRHLRFSDFRLPPPHLVTFIPQALVRVARRLFWLRPALKPGLCIKCGACLKICPAHAISMREQGIRFHRATCISCFCCMEVCPRDAIVMQGSSVVSLLMAARRLKHRWRQRNGG
ncbi:MAG TPA: DUF362 domain-containing protein [Candidatus Ozemobacteraceae bacterium]|nr:DUF362 domain-containing protein [Candidatus Ozemobacteraceae bacterium]